MQSVKIIRFCCGFMAVILIVSIFDSCSEKIASYDELEKKGETEEIVRGKYKGFFRAVKNLATAHNPLENSPPDSTVIKKAAAQTDGVIADFIQFPYTVDARLAFDALSYAAYDLSVSENFSHETVSFFWGNALLDPLFTKGIEHAKSEVPNESTQLQILKGLKRGMGTKATSDMLLNIIPVIGPNPSDRVMEICRTDSLVLRKIHDLIIYTRSLQKYGPPLWMTTGAWLLAVDIEGWPLAFYGLKPIIVDKALYLIFRDYNHGTFYAGVFDDPAPSDPEKTDAWLARAGAVMNSLAFNDDTVERISSSNLPVYDAHNFYNDYLLSTEADSVKKEFSLILKRKSVRESAFEFSGMDSISVLFTTEQIGSSEGSVTHLAAFRVQGSSMSGQRMIRRRKGEGTAFIIPMGKLGF